MRKYVSPSNGCVTTLSQKMAAVFKKKRAAIEAYFAKQDWGTIISELRLNHLISNTEEDEINSTESSKRAHTLTKILESKIVNNPDLVQNLKQFLGPSFEDFSELQQSEISTELIVQSLDGESGVSQELKTVHSRPSRVPPSYTTSTQSRQEHHWPNVIEPLPSLPASFQDQATCLSSYLSHPAGDTGAFYFTELVEPSPDYKYYDSSSTSTPVSVASHIKFHEVSVTTSKTKKEPSQHSKAFPGIDFSSCRSHATVDHRGYTIRGEGVQLRIPPKAIEGGTSLNISLQGCISGPFSLPEGIQLASPVFLVTCTPQYQFQRELTLTIHHFVLLQNCKQCKDMVLLTSPETKVEDRDYDYWKFHFCDQPLQCFPYASYGEVELIHFSFFCFGIRLSRARPVLRYRVSAHLPRRFISPSCSAIYSITICHEIYTENLKKYIESTYPDHQHLFCCTSEVISSEDIDGGVVLLELPSLKEVEQLGYILESDKEPCSIRKEAVNLPTMSRKDKKYAKRDNEAYPPRIVLTISEMEHVLFRSSTKQLHIKVTGIAEQSSVCQGFNLPILHRIKREIELISLQATVGGPGARGPTMPELLLFQLTDGSQISIPREVGTCYYSFGTHLLQDSTGSHISALVESKRYDAESINIEILRQWLSGEGMEEKTWGTLVSVLDKSGKGELAKKIHKVKLSRSRSDSEAN